MHLACSRPAHDVSPAFTGSCVVLSLRGQGPWGRRPGLAPGRCVALSSGHSSHCCFPPAGWSATQGWWPPTGPSQGPVQEVALFDRPRAPSLPLHTVISTEAAPRWRGLGGSKFLRFHQAVQTGPGAAREENKNLTVTAQQRLPPAPESQLFLKPAGPWEGRTQEGRWEHSNASRLPPSPSSSSSLRAPGSREGCRRGDGSRRDPPLDGAQERLWSQKASERLA